MASEHGLLGETEGELVAVVVTLREHLARLEAAEADKLPNQRRAIPTIPELAGAAGITRQAMYNFANGQIKMVNLETLSAVINELRQRGFPVDVADLLKTYPVDSLRKDEG